jgi:KDO2-lipid IV(A) lauroyltransferase
MEIQYLLEYLLLWPVVVLVRRLSEARSRAFARSLSRVAYRLLGHDRRWCLLNLELVFGANLNRAQRTKLAMQAFEHLVLTRFEAWRWNPRWMAARVIEEGCDDARAVCRRAAERGKGVIIISAHLGNFELLPAWGYHTGWVGKVLYRPQNNWRVERLLMAARRQYWRDMVSRGPLALRTLLHALRKGEGVGLMIDINTLDHGVFVDFLGFQAASPPGAAVLALATRAPVILAVSIRQPDGRHRIVCHPPFNLIDTGDRARDIVANTQQYMKAIEPYVLAHPEQYNWPHPRWRLRPDGSFWKLDMPRARLAAERGGPPRELRRGPRAAGDRRAAA